MGMMINRRRVYGGKSLPYDAEIEYLESTGTQWIDTGILQKSTHGYKTKVLIRTMSNNPAFPSVVQINGYVSNFGLVVGNARENRTIGIGNNNWTFTNIIGQTQTIYNIEYNYTNNSKTVINQSVINLPTNKVNNLLNIPLYCVNVSGVYGNFTPLVVYNFSITDEDNLILDFIPVRKNGVGYMYDKVSGQLFGNAGTGSFILGPDKGTAVTITQQQQHEMYGE